MHIWGKKWQATPVFLPGEFHEQRSLGGYSPWGHKDLDMTKRHTWRRKWQPTPVFLPGKFRGLRSLVGYSPWDRKESDTTERLHFHYQMTHMYSSVLNSHVCLSGVSSCFLPIAQPSEVSPGPLWKSAPSSFLFSLLFASNIWGGVRGLENKRTKTIKIRTSSRARGNLNCLLEERA